MIACWCERVNGKRLHADGCPKHDKRVTCHTFMIPGEGVAKGRPRMNRKTMTLYTPKATKVYEDCVALVVRASRVRYNRDTAVRVEMSVFTARKNPGDIDNISKSVLDGMQKGGMLEDDSQVWELQVTRVMSSNPRVEVQVNELGDKRNEDT